jgi:stress response protein SCP2
MTKGANVGLRDLDAGLGSVTVVLETAATEDAAVDADVSILLLGSDGRVRSNADMIFYNQRIGLDGAVRLRDKVRTQSDGIELLLDTLTVELDDIPDDVHRIIVLASLDPSLQTTFGSAGRVRMRIQRAADAQDLVSYAVTDASDETTLLFGEFYRREESWRVRAIGQGYADGLAQLAIDFGVEIDPSTIEGDAAASVTDGDSDDGGDGDGDGDGQSEIASVGEQSVEIGPDDLPTPVRLSIRRPQRAPKMPAAWDRTIPADDDNDWKRARLFPVAGIGAADEQEQRATSALLAVAALVKEFGRALVAAMGGPTGMIDAFTEVRFGQDENTVRPDGVLRSTWGHRVWTALIEVKTANKLLAPQIEAYVDVARAKGYDAVIMISNELTISGDEYPVAINRNKLRKVTLRHIGWDEIRNLVVLCLDHRGVADPTQRRVLAEFLRYMEHPRSGLHGLTDLGQHWVKVRDSAKNKTLRPADRGAAEVVNRFDQLVRRVSLRLSSLLGVEVSTAQPAGGDTVSRCQQFSDSGALFASIRVPGAVDSMVVGIDVRTERVSCSVTLPAPRDGRPSTRVHWLLRQLAEAPELLRVEALLVGARGQSTAEDLKTLRAKPDSILPADNRAIRAFRLTLELPMGTKRDTGRGSVVGSVDAVVCRCYGEVVQHLQKWTPSRPPKMPEMIG